MISLKINIVVSRSMEVERVHVLLGAVYARMNYPVAFFVKALMEKLKIVKFMKIHKQIFC